MKPSLANWIPKKYRQIVYAVAAFLVFDLGVLVLNFYTSYQISEDAVSINLAGRQRMLSQRMTKSLLAMQADERSGRSYESALSELRTTVDLFNTSLKGFETGGEVKGGDGKPIRLEAVSGNRGKAILASARQVWNPYLAALQPIMQGIAVEPASFGAAVAYGRANNVKLLGLMNDLTNHLEREASAKASRLRLIQTIGIALALLNFAFILVHFLRQLRESDQVIEAAQQETQEILSTVKEGLFLLGPDLRIGSQMSDSLPAILDERARPGVNLLDVLNGRVSHATLQATHDYVGLLFSKRVKESLMGDLNPLSLVEVKRSNEQGELETHYLSIHFNQVHSEDRVSHLLVTVQDVSEQVRLERQLALANTRIRSETEALLKLFTADSASLRQYLDHAQTCLLRINTTLKNDNGQNPNYLGLINGIFRQVHTLKGDAAVLGLDLFEAQAHAFEQLLIALREQPTINGNDLIAIPLKIDAFLDTIAMVRDIAERLGTSKPVAAPASFATRYAQLSSRIAANQGKAVALQVDLDPLAMLEPATQTTVHDIALQLLRNAVVHGIETPQQRSRLNKPEQGTVSIRLHTQENGEYELRVRDDGSGLSPSRIRDRLVESGRCTAEQVAQWDNRQLIMQIFEPGFSTADSASRDAGHGVGMDVVKQKIARLGARLRIVTRPDLYTEFSIRFSVPA